MYSYYDKTNGVRERWKPEGERLIGISAIKIFYCFYGRNAWHSTWVTRYIEFCMRFSLDEAKRFAEQLRKQGNVLYIRELPALMFHGREFSLIVTQINTTTPLSDYKLAGISERLAGAVPRHFSFGALFEDIARSFQRDSGCWKQVPPKKNSIMTLYTPEPRSTQESLSIPLANEPLKAWRSKSRGPDYYLNWDDWNKSVSASSTFDFVQKIDFVQPGGRRGAFPYGNTLAPVKPLKTA